MIKRKTMQRYIDDFDEAAQEFSMMGADPPETWEDTEKRYNQAKARLINAINGVYEMTSDTDDPIPL